MTTTPEGRRELKALAEAAAPGPWSTEHTCFDRKIPINGGITAFGRPYVIAHVNRPGSAHAGRDKANAAFIAAANPATVLSLLAALEEAEGREAGLREALKVAQAYALPTLNGIIESGVHPEIVATAEADKALINAALTTKRRPNAL